MPWARGLAKIMPIGVIFVFISDKMFSPEILCGKTQKSGPLFLVFSAMGLANPAHIF